MNDFYDQNAQKFFDSTIDVNMTELYLEFIDHLPKNAHILDAGCGSGRDTKYFLEKNYKVDAFDASLELVELAKVHAGIEVMHMRFDEVTASKKYDGIWACASLLHVESSELPVALNTLAKALTFKGVLYCSFKYGEFEGDRNGRHFLDFTEESFNVVLERHTKLVVEKSWLTSDKRPNRENEKWLNCILKMAE